MRRSHLVTALRPPEGVLARVRWFFLAFSFFFVVTYLPRVMFQSPRPLALRSAAAVALVLLAVWWLRCYRRGEFPNRGLLLEGSALITLGLAAEAPFESLGLLYIGVNFRSLYGTKVDAAAYTAVALSACVFTVLVAPALGAPDQLSLFLNAVGGVPVLAVITHLMAGAMESGERAAARERVLSGAGPALALATDQAHLLATAETAALALLPHPDLARVSAELDGAAPDPASTAGPHAVRLALVGVQGTFGVLVVDPGPAPIPAEARDALTALTSALSLGLGNAFLTEDLRRRADHDGLTGLANRSVLLRRLAVAEANVVAGLDTGFTLLMLDLDGFKNVNDTAGHGAGDELLKIVADRLEDCVRHPDLVARLGGDEFALVLHDAGRDTGTVVADRILAALSQPFELTSGPVTVGASIGVARYQSEDDADQLLRRADVAMYEAKRAGKGRARLARLTATPVEI